MSMAMNNIGFTRFIKPIVSSSFRYQSVRYSQGSVEAKPFSLLSPWLIKTPMCEKTWMSNEPRTYEILGPGMILLKRCLSLRDQINIVNLCEKWGTGPGGFYIPRDLNGEELKLRMMCFGRNWDPVTRYKNRIRSDGSEAPAIPSELISLVETALQDAQEHIDLPSMHPDMCVVNYYAPLHDRLGLHQDRDESSESLQRGLPVVSFSVGESANFLYGHTSNENDLKCVYLQSGDVLIFGGDSRLIYHELQYVFPYTMPIPLHSESALMAARLNLTFRQF